MNVVIHYRIHLLDAETSITADIDGDAETIAATIRACVTLMPDFVRAEIDDVLCVERNGDDVTTYDPHEDCPPMECSVCVERGKADVVDGRGWDE